jgi:hypothetical protein
MVAERRSLIVETVTACLLGGLLTVGVVCSSAQERMAHKAGAAAVASVAQLPQRGLTDAGNHQNGDSRGNDVSQRDEESDAERKARATGDLQRLDGLAEGVGGPMERVASLFEFLEHRDCAGGVCEYAQQLTKDYVRARAELIRRMLEAFLASDGADDGARERQELASLHADFTAEMAAIAERVPMLAMLPDILATTLGVPDYLEAPREDTNP